MGGKATNDTLDAHQIAVLRRGGRLPQADVYPAERRATRDLLRRRMALRRQRAALLPHVQQTHRHSHVPELGQNIASQANRAGVAARFPAPAVQNSLAVDRARLGYDDRLLTARALGLVNTAKAHKAQVCSRLRSLPGVGKILALGRRDDRHASQRLPRVPECGASGRRVKGAKQSAGQRYGTSGTTRGHASLTWACSEAAVVFLRNHPAGQKSRARLENNHGTGNALTSLAHT